MFNLRVVKRIWSWYTRHFRVVHFPVDIELGVDSKQNLFGFKATGGDPQLKIYPKTGGFPRGWYTLSYDASHHSGDHIFVPKIYPLYFFEPHQNFVSRFPKGFSEKNAFSRYLRDKQKERLGQNVSEPVECRETNKESRPDQGDICRPYPPGTVLNLRPHLPGKASHIFFYDFDSNGFRFDPFDDGDPRSIVAFKGNYSLSDLRLTYYGDFTFFCYCAHNLLKNKKGREHWKLIRVAVAIFRKKGLDTLYRWLTHKAYLKLQTPFSPTSWYRYFSQKLEKNYGIAESKAAFLPSLTSTIFIFITNSNPERLRLSVQSVLEQTHSAQQIFIVACHKTPKRSCGFAQTLAKTHEVITFFRCEISEFDDLLRKSKSDVIGLMTAGDRILPHAVRSLTDALADTESDIAYADEVITTGNSHIHKIIVRPGFSLDHFLNQPCLGLMTAMKAKRLDKTLSFGDCKSVESLNEKLILAVISGTCNIAHIPDIIFERERSAEPIENRRLPAESIRSFLNKCGFQHASVKSTNTQGLYSIRYNPLLSRKTTVIIPTKNNGEILKLAVLALERSVPRDRYELIVINHDSDDSKTLAILDEIAKQHRVLDFKGPFNFSKINNFAVQHADESADSFLFMNNDVEALRPGWLQSMQDKLNRTDVGIVGATLLYPTEKSRFEEDASRDFGAPGRHQTDQSPSNTIREGMFDGNDRYQIQHAGVILNVGIAEHFMKFEQYQDLYQGRNEFKSNPSLPNIVTRGFSAVTAACLLISKDAFTAVNGFDEELAVGFGDVDLCLKVGNAGFTTICDAEAVLLHHESFSRNTDNFMDSDPHPQDTTIFKNRYRQDIGRDVFYHPYLSPLTPNYRLSRGITRETHPSRLVKQIKPTP
ncbi:MAG: glycosyltransferase [Proteobacteria bacterium]|nr:glycosyltransferase [Pseudomonadota bacterium]